ncbi:MAG: 4-phosphopantetheinyl transferase superfamily protein [Sphingobacteriaceae bacterium]|jgi:phosphopantetheine--protein transferase-like protein|nr:4-phosphopantetheinyl transferase superfamily protein [Sphingobacteriaceae bacterium]
MALAHYKQVDAKTSFAIWKIEESAEELYNQLQLKDHETEFLSTLNNGKRNLHWLSTRALLRSMLNTDEYIDCLVDEHGKPYLANFPHQISLSHSYDYAAVMISEDKPVGIDIELIKNKIERVAKKFMSKAELDFIDQKNAIEHLYVCWCAKEAIYKLHGKKNISFLDNIELKPFEFSQNGQFEAALNIEDTEEQFQVFFEKFENYMIGTVAGAI